ncbi:MAG: hydantoinase B/oxoprolinase family protein [Acetobacterales bacterium]
MQIDPVTRELIYNALRTIADNMVVSVIRTSRSTVVKQNLDFSTGIHLADAQLAVQGLSLPLHLGAMQPALNGILARHGDNLHPGDILISNDPYEGASHLNDIFMYKPVFSDGRLIAFMCVISHHTDMGGRVAGGNATDSMEIFQEGFRIPPLKVYEEGRPNETFFALFEKQVRVPDKVLGDFRGQVAAVNIAEQEMHKLIEDWGADTVAVYMQELVDHAERLTRASIAELPDGEAEFTDYMDDNGMGIGPVRFQVKLTKKGDEMLIDWTGTSEQNGGALNPNFACTQSCTWAALRTVLSPDIPTNAGFYKPITVTAPEGCFLNPVFPAALGARGAAGYRVRHTVMGLLAQYLPDRMQACPGGSEFAIAIGGYYKDRTPFMTLEFHNTTGIGGGPDRDGQDAGPFSIGNLANTPMELVETEGPVMFERYAFIKDSEGAGEWRGGLGIVREYRFLADEQTVQVRSDRAFNPPWGLFGGKAGRGQHNTLNPDTAPESLPTKFIRVLKREDVFRAEMPGAGGYGDPWTRDPELVAEDVRQDKMTLEHVREAYGVVIDPATLEVDRAGTDKLRARGPAG